MAVGRATRNRGLAAPVAREFECFWCMFRDKFLGIKTNDSRCFILVHTPGNEKPENGTLGK